MRFVTLTALTLLACCGCGVGDSDDDTSSGTAGDDGLADISDAGDDCPEGFVDAGNGCEPEANGDVVQTDDFGVGGGVSVGAARPPAGGGSGGGGGSAGDAADDDDTGTGMEDDGPSVNYGARSGCGAGETYQRRECALDDDKYCDLFCNKLAACDAEKFGETYDTVFDCQTECSGCVEQQAGDPYPSCFQLEKELTMCLASSGCDYFPRGSPPYHPPCGTIVQIYYVACTGR